MAIVATLYSQHDLSHNLLGKSASEILWQVKLDALKYFIFDEADKMIKNDAFVQELEKISARIPEEIRVRDTANSLFMPH